MMRWQLEYWHGDSHKGPIEKWLDDLTKDEFKSVAKELKMLEIAGNSLKMPHSRALGSGLFELRERKYGFRIYYGFKNLRIIVLLAAGYKKTQTRDIKIARERLLQI